jgi:hypothetical protein
MCGITLSKFSRHAISCLAALVILPVLATDASPLGTVDIVQPVEGAGREIHIYGGGWSDAHAFAGVYMLEKSASSGAGDMWGNGLIGSFCIELEEPAPDHTVTYDVENTSDAYNSVLNRTLGSAKADALSELWGRYHNASWEGTGGFTWTEKKEASAFAAAVWEIVYEDLPVTATQWDVGLDGSAGIAGFRSPDAFTGLANSWLHSLDGTGPMASLAVFTQCGNQNYLVAVPEPTTIVLLGLGGIASLARKRRRA